MGLSNEGAKGKVFVSIVHGKFCVRVNADTEGAVSREITKGDKAGTTIYELQYSKLSGMIKSIEFKNKQFGDFVEIAVHDSDDFVLQLPWGQGAANAFVKMLPNIDKSLPLDFHTFLDKEGRTAFLIKQKGDWVKYAFTKDNPNGMPSPSKKTVRGKETWDWSAVEEFLFNELKKHCGEAKDNPEKEMTESEFEQMTNQDEGVPF
jgi:hypothetical protein